MKFDELNKKKPERILRLFMPLNDIKNYRIAQVFKIVLWAIIRISENEGQGENTCLWTKDFSYIF
jgi:hypothetical protein